MPHGNLDLNVGLELHNGKFLELRDLMDPLMDIDQAHEELPEMDNSSNLTLSLGNNSNSLV